MNTYDLLIKKLDAFIRKYYHNLLLKGAIYSGALIGSTFLAIALLAYFGQWDTGTRAILFWLFVAAAIIILAKYIIYPLLQLFKIGNRINHDQAAKIVGKHFPEVDDKLLNVLQLHRESEGGSELIIASINQKSKALEPVPFSKAIDFGQNKKYLRYLLAPAVVVVLLLLTGQGNVLKQGSQQVINYNREFVPEAPFQFRIVNDNLNVLRHRDFQLEVVVTGEELPDKVYLERDGNRFRLPAVGRNTYRYTFQNVQKDVDFRLEAAGFATGSYTLKALPDPALLGFEVSLVYPGYTGRKAETLKNSGDLVVPAGTEARWSFKTRNTDAIKLFFADTALSAERLAQDQYSYERRLLKDLRYGLTTANEYVEGADTVGYYIKVTPDAYPVLSVEEQADSANDRLLYFRGLGKDDYGFSRLTFQYRVVKESGAMPPQYETLEVPRSGNVHTFFHSFDIASLGLEAGDQVEYFFELTDNDAVNGPKSVRSQTQMYQAPTLEELKAQDDKSKEEVKDKLEESIDLAKDIQRDLDELQERMLEKKKLDFSDKQRLQNLLDKQKKLEQNMEEMNRENEKNNRDQKEYREQEERIQQKQEQLNKMFNELMSEEMKELMEEIEKLMEELNKDELQKQIEDLRLSNEDLEKELDRNLELFKQMEFEQKLQESIDKLDELQKEQEELTEETQKGEESNEELKKKQEELNKEFDELRKDLDDLEKKNDELEFKNNMPETDEVEEKIEQEMEQSAQELDKGNKKDASEKQKKSQESMEELSESLNALQQSMGQQQQMEDMEALRQLLDNLVRLSFEQEDLLEQTVDLNRNDPKFVRVLREQNRLKDDSKMIEDSLFALSKRVIQIESAINKEMGEVNRNMDLALADLAERRTQQASSRQQYVMTATNNLALLLSEVLNQMQNAMASMMKGSQSCEKPNNGAPSMSEMMKQQQKLAEQMKQMKGQMDQGKKPGDKQGQGQGKKMSEGLAKMAAQQEALRQQLREMADQMGDDGKNGEGPGGLQDAMKKMEETEHDLVNKRITEETIRRQEEILSRLLEAEKAEREREYDNKRESKDALQVPERSPNAFLEYQKLKMEQAEMLKTVPPQLSPFYRNLVNEYFNGINN